MRLFLLSLISLFFACPYSAQKKVLIEKFTNFACGHCPEGTLLLEEISADHPDVIWVLHHKPVGWIENELTNEQSAVLWDDLNAPGHPTAMFNRQAVSSKLTSVMSQWKIRVENQLELPYYAQVEVSNVVFQHDTRLLEFDVDIIFDELPNTDRFAISALIIEDNVTSIHQHSYYNEVAGHPLEGRGEKIFDYKHRNAVRTILDAPWGTNQAIPPSPVVGETYTMSYSYVIPETYLLDNMKIVAFVSNQDNDDVLRRTIFNTTEVELLDFGISKTQEIETITMSLSPNPTSDHVQLSFSDLPKAVKLYNLSGRLLATETNLQQLMTLDLTGFETGIYLIQAEIAGEKVVKKLVVSR